MIELLLFKIRANDNETIAITSFFDSGSIEEYKIIKESRSHKCRDKNIMKCFPAATSAVNVTHTKKKNPVNF